MNQLTLAIKFHLDTVDVYAANQRIEGSLNYNKDFIDTQYQIEGINKSNKQRNEQTNK